MVVMMDRGHETLKQALYHITHTRYLASTSPSHGDISDEYIRTNHRHKALSDLLSSYPARPSWLTPLKDDSNSLTSTNTSCPKSPLLV